jgi:hypothetical protein
MMLKPTDQDRGETMAKNGTIAYVTGLPTCQICKFLPDDVDSAEPPRTAEYDFKTQEGPWAYGCEPHYKALRLYSELGTGKGQKLEVRP